MKKFLRHLTIQLQQSFLRIFLPDERNFFAAERVLRKKEIHSSGGKRQRKYVAPVFLNAVAFIAVLFISGQVFAAEPAVEFVKDVTDKVISNVILTKESHDVKLAKFRKDFDEAMDLRAIGQFVLGRYWKTANESDRNAFLAAFKNFTTLTWSDRFDLYTGQQLSFSGARNADGGQMYVDSQVLNEGKPVEIIWRVKKEKDGSFKIIDIIVEGVSMAMSYRNEYASFLQKNEGRVSALTAELETKAKNFKFGTAKKEQAAKEKIGK